MEEEFCAHCDAVAAEMCSALPPLHHLQTAQAFPRMALYARTHWLILSRPLRFFKFSIDDHSLDVLAGLLVHPAPVPPQAKANRGILYVDEVNLLDDHLVDVLLDSAASGWNTVEREGISISHPARFILVGSGESSDFFWFHLISLGASSSGQVRRLISVRLISSHLIRGFGAWLFRSAACMGRHRACPSCQHGGCGWELKAGLHRRSDCTPSDAEGEAQQYRPSACWRSAHELSPVWESMSCFLAGNPEEGELRPQLLDRFGMHAEIRTVKVPPPPHCCFFLRLC